MFASSDSQMLTETKLAETYLEVARSRGSFRGVRRWRVVAVQHFPDGSASSIDQASVLATTGLTTLNFAGNKFYVARLNVVASDLTKTQAKSLLTETLNS